MIPTLPVTPEPLADYACVCGENPYWHPLEQRFYWTDIPRGRLYRLDPATGRHECCFDAPGRQVGGFTMQHDGSLLLFMDRGEVSLWRDGRIVATLFDHLPGEEGTRFNDVSADPMGRVFCGTMPLSPRNDPQGKGRPGRLYRLDTDGRITRLLDGIGCSNGMGFDPPGSDRPGRLYYTDTPTQHIYAFDYEPDQGRISNQQVFIDTHGIAGAPDGMTVDAAGDLWSTRWDGDACLRFARDGTLKGRIAFPVKKVSSVIFGGPDYEDMYFTTAGGDKKATDGPHAGAIFRARVPGVRGVPEYVSRVRL